MDEVAEFIRRVAVDKEDIADEVAESKRQEIKRMIADLEKQDSQIPGNIFKSVENVNLSTIIAYKDKDGNRHHFKDEY